MAPEAQGRRAIGRHFYQCGWLVQDGSERNRSSGPGEWSPEGRWRCFEYDGPARRDKLNPDILWLRDTSLEDAESYPEPDVPAQGIAEDLLAAMEQFAAIANELKE